MEALNIDPDFDLARKKLDMLRGPDRKLIEDANREAVKALEMLVDALEKDPDNCELHYECGKVLEKLGQVDLAIERYRDALELSPGHSGTLSQLASMA